MVGSSLVCWTLALLAVALAQPAIAHAYRSATPAEQSEMKRSAVIYHKKPHDYVPGTDVRIANVKVSTAASWALATVTLKASATGEQVGGPEIFRQIDGTWADVGPLNEEPASLVPKAVAKDLGVPYLGRSESSPSQSRSSGFLHAHSLLLRIELYTSWLIGIFFVLSAWLRWPSDFKRAGRSKLAWMAITLLGLVPYVGFIPALVYFFRVYRHLPNDDPGSPAKKPRARRPRYRTVATGRSIPCTRCQNIPGRVIHARCGGSGTVPGRGMFREPCGCGNGTEICPICKGTGVVPEYAREQVTPR